MRYHTTMRPVLDDDGKQIGFEQIDVPFTPDEEAEWDAMEAAHAAEAPKVAIRAQIASLESQITVRRQREAILGTDNGWLANINAQIAALRQEMTNV